MLQGYGNDAGHPLEGTTREKRCIPCANKRTVWKAGETAADAVKIEAAPTLQLNEKVDVPMMLRVIEHEAQTLSQHKHTFTFDVDNSLNVRGNEEQLRSAISNLVYNAVNHTPAGTHITVRWQHVPSGRSFTWKTTVRALPPSIYHV